MKRLIIVVVAFVALLPFTFITPIVASAAQSGIAEGIPFTEGTVWDITFVRVKPGMRDVYLRDIAPRRKAFNEAEMKEGLIISSHILLGEAVNKDDWDLMFITEYKNWAAFDGLRAKVDALANKFIGAEEKRVQVSVKLNEMRDIVGEKKMQELILK